MLLGTNDAMPRGGRITPDEYASRLRTLVDRLVADGAESVLVMSPPMNLARGKESENLRAFGAKIRGLCAQHPDVTCGPDLFHLLGPEHFAPPDPHPNGAAHAKIAAELEPMVRALTVRRVR